MKFAPAPSNEFREFIYVYYELCKEVCPKLIGLAGKWNFQDLIPGLSDFDTRLMFDDTMSISDWCEASLRVGEVHTRLVWEHPSWSRTLEHLPGVNVTPFELTEPLLYFPESRQWTFHLGDEMLLGTIEYALAERAWCPEDELFYLQRFARFWGPYRRGIDPPVNLGGWENKYALHSRLFHYFTPAVQSLVALKEKRPFRGKLASLNAARNHFPNSHLIDRILEAITYHYEIPQWYEEPYLSKLEDALRHYLDDAYRLVCDNFTLLDGHRDGTPEEFRAAVASIQGNAVLRFNEGAKFSRLMKGRLLFYAKSIPWFDSTWLIRNELGRIVQNLFEQVFRAAGHVLWAADLSGTEVLNRLRTDILSASACDGVLRFIETACSNDLPEKEHARQVADCFEPLQSAIETVRTAICDYLRVGAVGQLQR